MHGIRPAWNLLIGFPGEDEEVYKRYLRDIPLLTHLPPPSGAFPVRFDRYSPYFNRAAEYVAEQLADVAAAAVEQQVGALAGQGLLFEEGELLQSLVLPDHPPRPAPARTAAAPGPFQP